LANRSRSIPACLSSRLKRHSTSRKRFHNRPLPRLHLSIQLYTSHTLLVRVCTLQHRNHCGAKIRQNKPAHPHVQYDRLQTMRGPAPPGRTSHCILLGTSKNSITNIVRRPSPTGPTGCFNNLCSLRRNHAVLERVEKKKRQHANLQDPRRSRREDSAADYRKSTPERTKSQDKNHQRRTRAQYGYKLGAAKAYPRTQPPGRIRIHKERHKRHKQRTTTRMENLETKHSKQQKALAF
jgi:hypothetical protein